MVSVRAFNGSGDTQTPTKINLVFFWLIQIPLAYLLALEFEWGYSGMFWAVIVSETGVGIFILWPFSRGKWKNREGLIQNVTYLSRSNLPIIDVMGRGTSSNCLS